jgi:hypothetical protein
MHRVILCLLLVLLPLRSLLAAGQLGCEPLPAPTPAHHAGHDQHAMHGDAHDHGTKPCKLCAPCCLAVAPPPVLTLGATPAAPALRVAQSPAERWAGVVPPLPDPPPRG